jgi:hypothetical protein
MHRLIQEDFDLLFLISIRYYYNKFSHFGKKFCVFVYDQKLIPSDFGRKLREAKYMTRWKAAELLIFSISA